MVRLGHEAQQLSITQDGNLALCIVSAYHGRERGNFRTYKLDRRGYLVVNASTRFPRHTGDDAFFGGSWHKLAALALPRRSWQPKS